MSVFQRYAGDQELPLASYAGFIGVYGAGLGALLYGAHRQDTLPERIPLGDAVLLGLATHKLTRIVAKDWVTSPLRAPFAEYQSGAPGGEVKEKPRGRGLQKAMGDLITCNYCTGPWVALGLMAGYLTAPRATRAIAGIFAAVAASDWLHRSYETLAAERSRIKADTEEIETRTEAPSQHEQAEVPSGARSSSAPHPRGVFGQEGEKNAELPPTDSGSAAQASTEHQEVHPDDVTPQEVDGRS